MWCKACKEFYENFACNCPEECDCPKAQGLCECEDTVLIKSLNPEAFKAADTIWENEVIFGNAKYETFLKALKAFQEVMLKERTDAYYEGFKAAVKEYGDYDWSHGR